MRMALNSTGAGVSLDLARDTSLAWADTVAYIRAALAGGEGDELTGGSNGRNPTRAHGRDWENPHSSGDVTSALIQREPEIHN